MARESKNEGSVKSNAAAIQSSGRRGMLVSLLIGLLLLLMLDWPEEATATMRRLTNSGGALTEGLVASARKAGIEVLTLDARGDNERALALYRTLGFNEYERLVDFVAVGHLRYDKVFYAIDLRRPWPRL